MLTSLEPADGETILPLAALKVRLRIETEDDDADLSRMRAQAIDTIERYTSKALQQRQFQWLDKQFCTRMRLPMGPVESVDAISYIDSQGTDIELSAEDWYLGAGILHAASGKSWPYASGQDGAVRITFTAGFADVERDAPSLLLAAEMVVAAMYADRENPNMQPALNMADRHRTPSL